MMTPEEYYVIEAAKAWAAAYNGNEPDAKEQAEVVLNAAVAALEQPHV
jgi:hypothetical protein